MNHDIAYKVGEDDDDDDDYDDDDGLLQSLLCTFGFPRAKFGNYFSMFNPYLFRQESTERQFFKILLFTLKSILLSARQSVVAGPQML